MGVSKISWLTWAVLLAGLFISFFHRFAFGVVADDIGSALHLTATSLSNLGAVYFYVYGIMQIPAGLLIDRIGPRRISALGMILTALGSFLFGLAGSFGVAFLGRFLVGLGVSVIFLSVLKTQNIWFPSSEFSRLSGYSSAVGNFGALLASAPFALVVLAVGWRSTFILLGAISLIIALGIFLVSRIPRPETDKNEEAVNPIAGLKSVLTNFGTWPNFLVISGLMGSSMTLAGVWGITYLMQVQDWSKDFASYLILLVIAGFFIGSPVVGTLGTRLGRVKPVLNVGGGIAVLLWFLIIFFPGLPGWIWPFLYFGIGFFSIVFILCFTNVTVVNHSRYSGTATSVINFGAFTSSSLASLIIGVVLDYHWQGDIVEGLRLYPAEAFQKAFFVFIVFSIIGFVASFFIQEKGGQANEK